MMLLKCYIQYARKFAKLSSGHKTGKGQFTSQFQRRAVTDCSYYRTIVLISQASKVMFKILQARLLKYMNRKLPDVQAGFQRGRVTRDQIVNIHWTLKKAREFQKNIYFCFINYAKVFGCVLCGSQQTGKFLRRREYQNTSSAF